MLSALSPLQYYIWYLVESVYTCIYPDSRIYLFEECRCLVLYHSVYVFFLRFSLQLYSDFYSVRHTINMLYIFFCSLRLYEFDIYSRRLNSFFSLFLFSCVSSIYPRYNMGCFFYCWCAPVCAVSNTMNSIVFGFYFCHCCCCYCCFRRCRHRRRCHRRLLYHFGRGMLTLPVAVVVLMIFNLIKHHSLSLALSEIKRSFQLWLAGNCNCKDNAKREYGSDVIWLDMII